MAQVTLCFSRMVHRDPFLEINLLAYLSVWKYLEFLMENLLQIDCYRKIICDKNVQR